MAHLVHRKEGEVEDIPFIDDATLARETANTFLGDLRVREQRAACQAWVRGPVPADVHQLVRSAVPVLLLSGARDSVTPPAFAEPQEADAQIHQRRPKILAHRRHMIEHGIHRPLAGVDHDRGE